MSTSMLQQSVFYLKRLKYFETKKKKNAIVVNFLKFRKFPDLGVK